MDKLKDLLAIVIALALTFSIVIYGENKTAPESSGEQESSAEVQTVRIGYLPITHALAVFEEKEELEAAGDNLQIELIKYSSWPDLTDALNAGRIDGASVLVELAMSAAGQGIDLKAVALGHRDGNVIVAGNDIKSAGDLKGKTFAIPHTQSSHNILLNDMLKKNGLTADDLTVIQLAPTEMPSSLANGSIAGYCVAEPFGAQAVNQGFGHVLYSSEELWPDSLCCGLVVNGSFAEKNPKTVEALTKNYYKAGNNLDTEKAESIAENYLGQEKSVLETSLQWISFKDLRITKEAYNQLAEKVKEYGINDNPPTYEEFVYQ